MSGRHLLFFFSFLFSLSFFPSPFFSLLSPFLSLPHVHPLPMFLPPVPDTLQPSSLHLDRWGC